MTNTEPIVLNALLRCTQTDRKDLPLFECVREDLNLWIWELGPVTSNSLSAWISAASDLLRDNIIFLSSLSDSDDYTLHLSLSSSDDPNLLQLPTDFLGLAHEAGFSIEIYHEAPGSR